MDSKKKGLSVDTIDLSDLSFAGSMADDFTMEPLTISSISPIDSISITSAPGSITPGSIYSISGTGAAGANAIWTTSGTGPTWTTGTNGIDWSVGANIKPSGTIELKGEDADIKINDKSLMKTLETIEQRLGMLEPNPEMEKEWDELRELAERYRALEKQCIEKSEMWKKLKSMPPPEVK